MRKKSTLLFTRIGILGIIGMSATLLSGCMNDEIETVYEKFKDWRIQNEQYIADEEGKTEAGLPYYTKLAPNWAPDAYSLVHWHNDTMLTRKNLVPMDNSTVEFTYELFDIEGNKIQDSFSNVDSVYTSQPNTNIVGVWYPLTRMHEGDSVTIVMPYQAAYGARTQGSIKPYSALIYNIKLKKVKAYEIK